MIFIKLTKLPVKNPKKPIKKRIEFLNIRPFPIVCQLVAVSMIGGAIKANVDELTAPTREMNRSNLGIAAANETETERNEIFAFSFWNNVYYTWHG